MLIVLRPGQESNPSLPIDYEIAHFGCHSPNIAASAAKPSGKKMRAECSRSLPISYAPDTKMVECLSFCFPA